MKIQTAIVGIIVVSLFFMGATNFIDELGEGYNQTADYSKMEKLRNATAEQSARAIELQRTVNITLNKESIGDYIFMPWDMIVAGWQGIGLLVNSWTGLHAIIQSIAEVINIPEEVVTTIITLITVGLVVMLIFLFFKWRVES